MSEIDWDGLLADLRGKRDAYDAAIKAIENARSILSAVPAVLPVDAAPATPSSPASPAPVRPAAAPRAEPPKGKATQPCARQGCGETFAPRSSPGRPKRYCSKGCAEKVRRESEERIGATAALNRR